MGSCSGKPNQNVKKIKIPKDKNSQSTDPYNNDVQDNKNIPEIQTIKQPTYTEKIKNSKNVQQQNEEDEEGQKTRKRVKTMFNQDVLKEEQKKLDNNEDGYFTESQIIYFQQLLEKEQDEIKKELDEKKKKGKSSQIKWSKGDTIGQGAFGQVFRAQNQETSEVMAVKQIKKSNIPNCNDKESQEMLEALQSEIEILKYLNHKNIVKYYGATYDKKNKILHIFLEYISEGSICNLSERFYGKFQENIASRYMLSILEGLQYLHYHKVVHRDIKCANILVEQDGTCKLADFGSSKRMVNQSEDDKLEEIKGTVNWMAPEAIRQIEVGRFSDIWSLGCTLLEMLTGKMPFHQFENIYTAMYQIGSGKHKPEIPEDLSQNCKSFLNRCFEIEPKKRANVCELLKHPFILQKEQKESHLQTPSQNKNVLKIRKSMREKQIDFVLSQRNSKRNQSLTPSPLNIKQRNNNNKKDKSSYNSFTGIEDGGAITERSEKKNSSKNLLQQKKQAKKLQNNNNIKINNIKNNQTEEQLKVNLNNNPLDQIQSDTQLKKTQNIQNNLINEVIQQKQDIIPLLNLSLTNDNQEQNQQNTKDNGILNSNQNQKQNIENQIKNETSKENKQEQINQDQKLNIQNSNINKILNNTQISDINNNNTATTLNNNIFASTYNNNNNENNKNQQIQKEAISLSTLQKYESGSQLIKNNITSNNQLMKESVQYTKNSEENILKIMVKQEQENNDQNNNQDNIQQLQICNQIDNNHNKIKNSEQESDGDQKNIDEVNEESDDDGNLTEGFENSQEYVQQQQNQQKLIQKILSMEAAVQKTFQKNKTIQN